MKIELSQAEVNLIEKALDCWEKESHGDALSSMMLGAMLRRKEDSKEEYERETKIKMDEATAEANRRKRVSTLLRAKLYQADARLSEMEVPQPLP